MSTGDLSGADWLGYALGIAGVAVAAFAWLLVWLWRRDDHALTAETKVLVTALGTAVDGIEAQFQ
jgi:hypothetical protein